MAKKYTSALHFWTWWGWKWSIDKMFFTKSKRGTNFVLLLKYFIIKIYREKLAQSFVSTCFYDNLCVKWGNLLVLLHLCLGLHSALHMTLPDIFLQSSDWKDDGVILCLIPHTFPAHKEQEKEQSEIADPHQDLFWVVYCIFFKFIYRF